MITDEYYEIYSLSTAVNMSQGADRCVLAIINADNQVPAVSEVLTRYIRSTLLKFRCYYNTHIFLRIKWVLL